MANGYMGKILFVDLSTGKIAEEGLDDKLCRDFLGGYGMGARVIYSRQKGGVDPMGPDNILGFTTGPLTGAPSLFGSRYAVVGKSPLTQTWGDANSGGFFGPMLKYAGYDHVFFTGISDKPVYLFIEEGKAELRDASHLWGKDSSETEDVLKKELGNKTEIACIGQAGEKLSLISGVINNKGRAAARSGLGAVMGSKRLKAIAVLGTRPVPLANKDRAGELRKKYNETMAGMFVESYKALGTCGFAARAAYAGQSPVKNWGGVGIIDFPNAAAISDVSIIGLQEKKFACSRCPIGCGGEMKAGTEYNYPQGTHKPEYETIAAFGSMLLINNAEAVIMANSLCNRYGLDTMSAGTTLAFAAECYENGIISRADTDGLELSWGNHHTFISMLEKMCKREGFGDILADGVKVAAEKIGKGSEQFAMHIHGQEVPMQDPRLAPSFGVTYITDATPARHTQGGAGEPELVKSVEEEMGMKLPGVFSVERYVYTGKAPTHAMIANSVHALNACGLCRFTTLMIPQDGPVELLAAVTGWDFSMPEYMTIGERIANMRQAFNVREGHKPGDFQLPNRIKGIPSLKEGPLANVTIDVDSLAREYLQVMDWDPDTGKPSRAKLMELGLDDVAESLY